MNDEVLRYLQANDGRYTRQALQRRLLAAGFSADEIDEAAQSMGPGGGGGAGGSEGGPPGGGGGSDGQPPQRLRESGRFWAGLVGYVVLAYAGLAVIGGQGALDIYALAVLVGGTLFWAARRSVDRPLAAGVGCGVITVIALPIVFFVGLWGYCLLTQAR